MKDALEAVRSYHTATNQHRKMTSLATVEGFQPMEVENRPNPFKVYEGTTKVALPTDFVESHLPAADVLGGGRGASLEAFDLGRLAHLLFFCGGVTRTSERPTGRAYFRTAPSAGNLHPLETYVVVGDVAGLEPGVYHVDHATFSLDLLRSGDWRPWLARAAAAPDVAGRPATVVVSGIFWRTAWKYAERGLRHVYWDAGTMLANLLAVSDATGVACELLLGFDDAQVAELLGVDGDTEFPVVLAPLGNAAGAAALGEAVVAPDGDLPTSLQLSPRPVRFPMGTAAHAAGTLSGPEAVERWRQVAASATLSSFAADIAGADAPETDGAGIEEVILRRGSTRLFRLQALAPEQVSWPLRTATRPVRGDVWAGGSLLALHASVHAVDGMAPGRYRWDGSSLVLVDNADEQEARTVSQALCCDQPLGGDSAVTVYEWVDLDGLLEVLGPRGYRAAQVEAGIVAGRLHLAAYAGGFGATSLTFFDDEVKETFGAKVDGMLVTCLGVPDYRSAAGGRPGQTTELRHWAKLMDRFSERFQREEQETDG